jgi:hypothetical protein
VTPDKAGGTQSPEQRTRHETLHQVHHFLVEQIIGRYDGAPPSVRTIAVRLIVFAEILQPTGRSLSSYAEELGVSRAYLSKIALQFADRFGLRAEWQRVASRDQCAERARGVHDGTWIPGAKHERRKLREARRDAL